MGGFFKGVELEDEWLVKMGTPCIVYISLSFYIPGAEEIIHHHVTVYLKKKKKYTLVSEITTNSMGLYGTQGQGGGPGAFFKFAVCHGIAST